MSPSSALRDTPKTALRLAIAAAFSGFSWIGAPLTCLAAISTSPVVDSVDYNRDIKPLLAAHCYACHGPDDRQRKADLRLDLREVAIKKAIHAGDAAGSPLLARVASENPDESMPPPDSKIQRLTGAEIELLRKWIDAGAKFEPHWAYVPPSRHEPPTDSASAWGANEIDRFVFTVQKEHGFSPATEASRVDLIRRVSFDLTGLPPTPEEVEAFVASDSPAAYAELVERLLASPHHGERMATFWLDLTRYADTNGYHADLHRNISPYRDYVIRAFNENKPFDRFTIEQLAGDLEPDATTEQLVASGYNRLNQTTTEGGAQAKEYLAKYAADRVRNASTVWMGATLGCAECHDHKFDPYTTKDFYRFAAFFADLKQVGVYENKVDQEPQTRVLNADQARELLAATREIVSLEKTLETPTPELAAGQKAWETEAIAKLRQGALGWTAPPPKLANSSEKATLTIQDDASILASGENPPKDVYTVEIPLEAPSTTGLRVEALTHSSLTAGSLSRANGNFVLTKVEVEVRSRTSGEITPVKLASATADYSQNGFPIEATLDDDNNSGWGVDGHSKAENRAAIFVFEKPVEGHAGATLIVRLRHESIYSQHNIGRFRLALTSAEHPSLGDSGLPENIQKILALDAAARSPEQLVELAKFYRGFAPELAMSRARLAELLALRQKINDSAPATLVSLAVEPAMTRILPRGNWMDDSGELVEPGVPEFLAPLRASHGKRANRLDLAQWLVARENPLVARVFVNRLWKLCFGAGLSTRGDDFGAQGARPSHPELLDWLAVEFMEKGWNVRHILRLMVMSATYRQTSVTSRDPRDRDPGNRFLARQARFRLDAEFVRDNALAISGLLSRKIGGRSVKPYQPDGYWDLCNTFLGKLEYDQDHGEDLYRRGLYTYWKRTFLHPSLAAFDAPSHEECTADRPRSSTPLQALILLNDPTYVEAARVLAERALKEGGATFEERLAWSYRRALGRPVKESELVVLKDIHARHLAAYQGDPTAAAGALSVGEAAVSADTNPAELAAMESVARVILNLYETNTRP